MYFLLVLTELFSLGITAEALYGANECLTTLSLTVFKHRKFVADFLQAKCEFIPKSAVLRFDPPLGDLGATYDDDLRLIGKRI